MAIRIAFFTNATSKLSLPVLQALHRSDDFIVARIFFYDTIAASRGRIWSVIKEHGLKNTIAKALDVFGQKLKSIVPAKANDGNSIKSSLDYAAANEIPHRIVRSVNDSETTAAMAAEECEFLVCCSLSQIMRTPILSTPKTAAINIHPSLLPRYRGPLPSFWVLKNNESQSGVTFHLMGSGIDNGKIIDQFSIEIEEDWNEDELTTRLFELAAENVVRVLTRFSNGELMPYAQDESQATYFSFPKPADRKTRPR